MRNSFVHSYRWEDGSPVDFTTWSGGEPNDAFGAERCGQIHSFNGTSYWSVLVASRNVF